MTWSVTLELVAAAILISVTGLIYFRRAGAALDRRFGREDGISQARPADRR